LGRRAARALTFAPWARRLPSATAAPRLGPAVERLRDEHRTISRELAQLAEAMQKGPVGDAATWINEQRDQCVTVLGRLTRHRQRGADLTYEAYADVGGDG